jgi:DNA-binding response OmpR family regulator
MEVGAGVAHHGAVSSPSPSTGPSGRTRHAVVVDDEVPLARLVAGYLERDGFTAHVCHDGAAAVDLVREVDPEIVVLDLGLPGLDGVEVCRRIRTFSDCYVLMLTARAEEVDTLIGLSVGADEYMTKPFSPRELMARVGVLLRRPRVGVVAGAGAAGAAGGSGGPGGAAEPASAATMLEVGGLRLDLAAREAHVDGREVALTRTEFDLLAALAARPGLAFTRRLLVESVWGPAWVGDEHLVDVHVLHLRRKLGDTADAQRFVRTVRGVGYRMGTGA